VELGFAKMKSSARVRLPKHFYTQPLPSWVLLIKKGSPTMNTNQVEFTPHALDRVLNRYNGLTNYGEVQTVLVNTKLTNGMHQVTIKTLKQVTTVFDENSKSGQITGRRITAVVETKNNSEVKIITLRLDK
jgi:hypothetical protein